ncbi:unnamed protein product [Lota lota]
MVNTATLNPHANAAEMFWNTVRFLPRSLGRAPEGPQDSNTSGGTDSGGGISSFKSSQAQLEETKLQRDELKAEVQRLKKELETRPTLKELKHQHRVMERWIQRNSRSGFQ